MRLSIIFFCAAWAAVCVAHLSCGRPEPTGKNITVILPSDTESAGINDEVVRKFTEKTGISVSLQQVDWGDLHNKLVVAFASKKYAYDVAFVDVNWVSEFSSAGWLEPVDEKLSDAEKGAFLPQALKPMSYQGKLAAMPWTGMVWIMHVNGESLKKAGVVKMPETWDEFAIACRLLKSAYPKKYPVVFTWKQHAALVDSFAVILATFGGRLLSESGEPHFAEPEGVHTLEFMSNMLNQKMADPSSLTADNDSAANSFMLGLNPFMNNWHSWHKAANTAPESKIRGKATVLLTPGTQKVKSATLFDVGGLGIPSTAKDKESALSFIKFISGPEMQKVFVSRLGNIPTVKSLFDDKDVQKQVPELAIYKKQLEYAIAIPKPAWYGEFQDILQLALQNALLGKQAPSDALWEATEKVKALREKAGVDSRQ